MKENQENITKKICLVNAISGELKELAVNENQMGKLWKMKETYTDRGLVNFNEVNNDEDMKPASKYEVTYSRSKDKERPYQIEKLTEIFPVREMNVNYLNKIKDAEQADMKHSMIGYIEKEEFIEEKEISESLSINLYELSNFNIISNKLLFYENTIAKKVKILDCNKLMSIPYKKNNCIANFYRKDTLSVNDKGNFDLSDEICTLDVYNAIKFDDILDTQKIQEKYTEIVIGRFQDESYKITTEEYSVEFSENEVSEIKDLAKENNTLRKTLAKYNNNGNRTIKKIKIGDLDNALNRLKEECKKNAKVKFNIKNIPQIDKENKKLIVTKDSLPIFSALLDNMVIERILTGKLSIPFYSR